MAHQFGLSARNDQKKVMMLIKENAWSTRLSIRVALLAVLTALTTVLTMTISIPVPATQGYINLGDACVLLAGLLLGPLGGVAGGLGSALADYGLGYMLYVPITFVVKGLEAAVAGVIFWVWKPVQRNEIRLLLALLAGSIVMVLGYLLAETFIVGFWAALVEVPGNIFQVSFGSLVSAIVFLSINRVYSLTATKSTTSNSVD